MRCYSCMLSYLFTEPRIIYFTYLCFTVVLFAWTVRWSSTRYRSQSHLITNGKLCNANADFNEEKHKNSNWYGFDEIPMRYYWRVCACKCFYRKEIRRLVVVWRIWEGAVCHPGAVVAQGWTTGVLLSLKVPAMANLTSILCAVADFLPT